MSNIITRYGSVCVVLVFLCAVALFGQLAHAQEGGDMAPISAFKHVFNIKSQSIVVPTVVELKIPEGFIEREGVLVVENNSRKILPYFFNQKYTQLPESFTAHDELLKGLPAITDGTQDTSYEYPVVENEFSEAIITLKSSAPVAASRIALDLAPYVALPETVEIRAEVDGVMKIVVAKRRVASSIFNFPQTVSDTFVIRVTYSQPLRISEIRVVQDSVESSVSRSVRFLAQPKESYRVFMNPDRAYTATVSEAGDLRENKGVRSLSYVAPTANVQFTEADIDEDGILDVRDNCPRSANPEQEDIDGSGVGDSCEDFDKDGIVNSSDNCPQYPNRNQRDEDGDSIGDTCDEEESRFTERYVWVPWAGMGIAFLVIVGLFAVVLLGEKKKVT